MGQSWDMVAFNLRQRLISEDFDAKLGRILYDGTASRLVLPLAVPILPQGFSLTQAIDATAPVPT